VIAVLLSMACAAQFSGCSSGQTDNTDAKLDSDADAIPPPTAGTDQVPPAGDQQAAAGSADASMPAPPSSDSGSSSDSIPPSPPASADTAAAPTPAPVVADASIPQSDAPSDAPPSDPAPKKKHKKHSHRVVASKDDSAGIPSNTGATEPPPSIDPGAAPGTQPIDTAQAPLVQQQPITPPPADQGQQAQAPQQVPPPQQITPPPAQAQAQAQQPPVEIAQPVTPPQPQQVQPQGMQQDQASIQGDEPFYKKKAVLGGGLVMLALGSLSMLFRSRRG
jgi:hypothetical protein